ncbi:histidine kinase [Nocardiopsis sp. RSe5-2]|uniref:histidine kinase n=1 Tax=Nocardiopsis endophytica TaxID=3018445 RepID=A0ABT4UCX9_9ACTN|nr:histidine kinase [Nocardiopsis endophytica]MDA2814840.1 histidine kinase [Nocardiopsis endophytica]
MRKLGSAAALAAVVAVCVVNALGTVQLPAWRQGLFLVLLVAAYLHGRRLPQSHGPWILAAGPVAGLVVMAVVEFSEGTTVVLCTLVFVALPWTIGRFRGQQAALVAAQRQRVEALERERESVEEKARLRERARIASDMHDSLGHDLALIALRAGALELSQGLSEADREAAAALRSQAVEATDRLRGTVAMLRGGAAPVSPHEEGVEALVERAREAGLDVRLSSAPVRGDQDVQWAVRRIVKEALTNAARHAPGAPVDVEIEDGGGVVGVVVSNELREGELPGAPAMTGGSGLAGLAERVRLLGGALRAGEEGGRFVVAARLPVEEDR